MDPQKESTDVNSNDQVCQVTPSDRLSEVLSITKLIPHQSPGKVASLCDLNGKLRQIFDQFDNIDVDHIQDLMASYNSNPRDWRKYCHFDRHRWVQSAERREAKKVPKVHLGECRIHPCQSPVTTQHQEPS